jgi:serine/threonine-protein kinase HipA
LGLEYSSIEQLFRRMAFNVLIGEFDDHTKNFSFMLKEGEAWELAPAYDLTGSSFDSNDPWDATSGSHQLSINGKFSNITKDDMLKLADRVGVGNAAEILNDIKNS